MIHQPQHPLLRNFVKQINQFSLNNGYVSSFMSVPTGNTFVTLFCGGGAVRVNRPSSGLTIGEGIFITGQQLETIHHVLEKQTINIIAFELVPDGLKNIFGLNQRALTGKIFNMEEMHIKVKPLLQMVRSETDDTKRRTLIEDFLCMNLLKNNKDADGFLSDALSIIKKCQGNIKVDFLAKHLKLSKRSLERKFLDIVGVTPKAFCKTVQFYESFKKIFLLKHKTLDVSLEYGYYDQAHFTNHFKKVMGVSPTDFFKQQGEIFYLDEKEMIYNRSVNMPGDCKKCLYL